MKRKRIGFLGYDGVMALDLAAPIDAFTTAETCDPRINGKGTAQSAAMNREYR